MRYSIDAPAKINLYLDVLSKRENGYHDIKSVMQSVSICDKITISVEKSKNTSITLYGNNNSIAWDESNLVYKACSLFIKEAGIEGYSFTIYVEKKIPIKAGMGGGSTDAAATLNLLNDIFDEKFTEDEVGRITRMKINRMQLTENGVDVVNDSINSLKKAVNKKLSQTTNTYEGLNELLTKMRSK